MRDRDHSWHRMGFADEDKDLFSVEEKDSLELVINIMKWKNIHHMPVINSKKELIGLLSWTDIKNHINEIEESTKCVQNFMKDELIAITKEKSVATCFHATRRRTSLHALVRSPPCIALKASGGLHNCMTSRTHRTLSVVEANQPLLNLM